MSRPLRRMLGELAQNVFVRAALSAVGLLALTAATLVFVASIRGGARQTPKVVVDEVTGTMGPTSETAEATGIRGTTKLVTAVHAAPGTATALLGTIPRDAEVVIDGRSSDARWYRTIYPLHSEMHSWIDADSVRVTGDPSTLLVATPELPVVIEVPTEAPPATPAMPAPTDVFPTPAPDLPDLVVETTPTISGGGTLVVTVVNQGRGAAQGDLVVAVFDSEQTRLLGGRTLPAATLASGQRVDIDTGLVVAGDETLLVIVNPNDTIAELDVTNSRALVHVQSAPLPTAAVTPTAILAQVGP